MQVRYERGTDSLTITLREDQIEESDELRPGCEMTTVNVVR
jgi:hypothetical protein